MSSIKVKISAYFVVIAVSLLLLEVTSLSVYAVKHIVIRDSGVSEFRSIMSNHYSKIFTSKNVTGAGEYDPVTQMQFPANFNRPFLKINEFGFLSNGSSDTLANSFPAKNNKIYRVIMLGGSSMFGSGVDSNTKTISAHLERIINSSIDVASIEQKYVQVLNFGHPGAHSSIELAKLSNYLIHLEPDLIISFDGFNDAWYALFEHNRQAGEFPHGIINWADNSYHYYDHFSGGEKKVSAASFYPLSYIIPTTSSLAASVYNKLFPADLFAKIKEYPPYKISSFIKTREGDFASGLLANYAAMGGLACAQGVRFYGILQPHALENYENLTESEKEKMSIWEKKYGAFTGGIEGYSGEMSNLYDKYEAGLTELNTKFLHCPKVEFLSFRNLFDKPRSIDLYVDNIHYTEQGNKQLALEMAPLIKKPFLD